MAAVTTALLTAAAIGAGAYTANQAQKSAKSLAEQQMNEAKAEQARLEEKYGLTTGELEREQRLFGTAPGEEKIQLEGGLEATTQAEKERRAGLSGEALLAEAGPDTQKLLDVIGKRLGMSGEELFREISPTAGTYADIVGKDLQDPYATYESTLAPELELARQMVNQEANKRGVFAGLPEGGIRFEQLGRAGIDLAIKSAQDRMAYRQQALNNAVGAINAYSTLETGARGEAATVGTAALSEKEKARQELDNLLANMQNLQATAKGREANVAVGASNQAANANALSYDTLQSILGQKQAQATSLINTGLETAGDIITSTPAKTTTTTPKTDTISLNDLLNQPSYRPKRILGELSGSEFINN